MGTENASSSCFPSSSSTSAPRWTYEYNVFLSFRGSDTRKKFTSHLYEALKRHGITTFRDDESLDRGAFIKPELLKAIEESKIAVVILSRDYASSSWCLTELAKVFECMAKKKLIVLPVFHDVDPSDVRKLRGTFEDAFAKHLIDNTENVQTWKDAVTEVAGISGWDLRDEPESTVIEKIIQRINKKLDREVRSVSKHRVGMESRVQGMLDLCLGKELNDDEALKLFSWKAFKKPHPKENYVDLSKHFVKYADGFPLALEVLGSLLFGKRIDEWESVLEKLKAELDNKIFNVLKISFDGLSKIQQELFLDIACFFKGELFLDIAWFFKGEYKDGIKDMFQSFGFCPDYNIGFLVDRSLITISEYGTLCMHDLLQEMGQDIVRREFLIELGRRSRLWRYEDVLHVLKNNIGTKFVEGIVLKTPGIKKEYLSVEAFSKMTNLRILKIGYVRPPQDPIRGPIQLPQGLNYLSNELRLIDWYGYPLKSLPISFQPNKLVVLRMRCSDIKQLWKGIMILNELKLIDLSDSQNLIEIPDLSGAPNLKELCLRRCTRLYKIHASLGDLKRLIRLDLYGCKCLESLPHNISLEALEFFSLGGCSKLKKFPDSVENMSRLSKHRLSETAIKDCKNLSSLIGMLERSLIGLCSVTTLDLSNCNVQTIPNDLGCLSSLEMLDLKGNNFVCLPKSIIELSKLRAFYIGGCTHLRMLPKLPLNIEYIDATMCTSLETLSLRREYNFQPSFSLLNCDKLIKNQGYDDLFSTVLRNYIVNHQGRNHRYESFSLEIPGSEIPKWFSHQNMGASVNVQVPSDSLGNELMGIIVCAVFIFRQHLPLHQLHIDGFGSTHYLLCSIGGVARVTRGLSEEFGRIEWYQLLMQYFPSKCSGAELKDILNQVDSNGFSQIEVKYKPFGNPGLEVTKCGAHLVYEQDIGDLINQTKAGPSSCIITPYDEDGFDNSVKDSKIKRSSDDSDGEGAGPSGEATSNDIDVPKPKSVQLPNLIQRLMLCLGNWIGSLCAQRQGDSDCEEEEFQ